MENLLGFDQDALSAFFCALEEPEFRARQVIRWIHRQGCADFGAMSDVSKSLRSKLADRSLIQAPRASSISKSFDGTTKYLFDISGAGAVESVFIPERDRGTICVSTQAGCSLDCSFCSTGRQGFARNLTASEIIGQVWHVAKYLSEQASTHSITNVVFMGMGEPLANFDNLVSALRILLDDNAYGLSRRRVTVSTSGILPAMRRLADECPVSLAVSLHAPTDELRDELVPINRKYPIRQLMEACRQYLTRAPRDFVTFEYVMLAGVNDSVQQAELLARVVSEVPCKINLIPFNPFLGAKYKRSTSQAILAFSEVLRDRGYVVTTRRTRGDDVDAACGQLAGKVQSKVRRIDRAMSGHGHQSSASSTHVGVSPC